MSETAQSETAQSSYMEAASAAQMPEAGGERRAPFYRNEETDQKRQDFENLIRGEYKSEFDERVRKIIDKRFRDMRLMKEHAAKIKPVMDALSEKYGENDAEKLVKMLKEDAAGKQQINRHAHAVQRMMKWNQDAEQIKRMNPGFDLKNEMQNRAFTSLLRAGVDMKTAYQTLHQDEILEKAVRYAAEKARDQTMTTMRRHASRPAENGSGGRGGATMAPVSVQNMTRAEREEIERRCARGEKVYFS